MSRRILLDRRVAYRIRNGGSTTFILKEVEGLTVNRTSDLEIRHVVRDIEPLVVRDIEPHVVSLVEPPGL